MYIPGQTAVDPNEIQLITSYVVPARGGAICAGVIAWAGVPAEIYIYHNGVYCAGGRISAASPTLQLQFGACPIGLNGSDVLLVMGEHNQDTAQILKATLMVDLL